MTVNQLARLLDENSGFGLGVVLPDGGRVPDHFHVTDVGRVQKDFIDCGGTRREHVACVLQVWTADDVDHRLAAGKLSKILKLAGPLLGSTDLPVEIEYGSDVAGQYRLVEAQVEPGTLVFVLAGKKTDCLAPDQCGVSKCCAGSGCC